MIPVKDIMTTDVVCLNPEATLDDARVVMTERNIRHVPVIDSNDQIEGLISHRDLLAYTLSEEIDRSREHTGTELTVAQIMRRHLLTTGENTDIRVAGLKMQEHKVGCLLIVRDKKLVGIVTDWDYVGLAINLLEQMESLDPTDVDDY